MNAHREHERHTEKLKILTQLFFAVKRQDSPLFLK